MRYGRSWPTAGVDPNRPSGRCIAHTSHRGTKVSLYGEGWCVRAAGIGRVGKPSVWVRRYAHLSGEHFAPHAERMAEHLGTFRHSP